MMPKMEKKEPSQCIRKCVHFSDEEDVKEIKQHLLRHGSRMKTKRLSDEMHVSKLYSVNTSSTYQSYSTSEEGDKCIDI